MDEHLLRFDKDKTYVLIDCETENLCLHHCHNLPWQIGMIKTKGDNKIAEKNLLVKWDRPINVSRDAARITKFDLIKYKKESVYIDEIFPTVKSWLDEADYIIGHNILGFDIYLIKHMYERIGKSCEHLMPKIIDTMCVAKGVKMGLSFDSQTSFLTYQYKMLNIRKRGLKTNLEGLGKEFKIDHDYANLHDAVNDLELNLEVWKKLKWQVEI
jgi:DNA polymerase III epsilon subunit-like protein